MALKGLLTGEIVSLKKTKTKRGRAALHMVVDATQYVETKAGNRIANNAEQTHLSVSLWDGDAEYWSDLLEVGDIANVEGVFARKRYKRKSDQREAIAFVLDEPRMVGFIPDEQTIITE